MVHTLKGRPATTVVTLLCRHAVVKRPDCGSARGRADNKQTSLRRSDLDEQNDVPNSAVSTDGLSMCKPLTVAATNATLQHHKHSMLKSSPADKH